MNELELIELAKMVRNRAFAPFSNFKVGAVLVTSDNKTYTGCNIESASYGLTVCAERVAIWKALSDGENSFSKLIVVTDVENPAPPCGACRQIIWEFCGNISIVLSNLNGKTKSFKMKELLPNPFGKEFLE
ncbi:MAG: cytidine deaminase [Pyrinomonadaceae bacterium]|nr:cytidine deaminase [Pyrinomonadaceae bacterium]MCX7640432.1 cytidine deaminase [Pyrinomonadaceae bacterium]MDW8304859.1 cytidine deaminase [Acidobacteriota bacterium]